MQTQSLTYAPHGYWLTLHLTVAKIMRIYVFFKKETLSCRYEKKKTQPEQSEPYRSYGVVGTAPTEHHLSRSLFPYMHMRLYAYDRAWHLGRPSYVLCLSSKYVPRPEISTDGKIDLSIYRPSAVTD